MKHLKMLGAVAATMALVAFLGGGTASATVLCKTETNPCSAVYPEKTELKTDLVSSQSIFELTNPEHTELSRCSKENLTASISKAGNVASTVVAPITTLEFGECMGFTKVVLQAGSLEIHSIPGTNNGTVTATELEFTFFALGIDCKWRVTNADMGTLKGGSDPTLEVNILLARNSVCYPEWLGRWTATFTFTSPIYVEPS